MYDHLNFQSINIEQIADYDGLIEAVTERFQYQEKFMNIAGLSISDNGTLTYGDQEGLMTKEAFIKFCKQLRIPDPFAKFIPWELLKYNIETLTQHADKGVQVYTRSDGVVVNITKEDFVPIPHDTFIEVIREHAPNIKRGVISDINMTIDVTNPVFSDAKAFEAIEPEVGDITETGLNFNNSTCGHTITSAKLFLLRLVCTNGMILPTSIGYAKLRTKPGRDLAVSTNNFLHQIEDMAIAAGDIQQRMQALNAPLNSLEFSLYWKGLNKIVKDPEFLDEELFEVDKENRQLYRANERAHKKHPEDTALMETTVNGYRLLNNITVKAKDFQHGEKTKMEAYAGKILMYGEA